MPGEDQYYWLEMVSNPFQCRRRGDEHPHNLTLWIYIEKVAIARHLLYRLRHDVVVANSRGPETLTQLAKDTGAKPVTVCRTRAEPMLPVPIIPIFIFPFIAISFHVDSV